MTEPLPDSCYVFIAGNAPGQRIGLVKRGEPGYYRCDFDVPSQDDRAVQFHVMRLNARLGVTPLEAECMQSGSLFGWDVPAADPARMAAAAARRGGQAANAGVLER